VSRATLHSCVTVTFQVGLGFWSSYDYHYLHYYSCCFVFFVSFPLGGHSVIHAPFSCEIVPFNYFCMLHHICIC
jgi:hypothetical protein